MAPSLAYEAFATLVFNFTLTGVGGASGRPRQAAPR